MTRLDSIHPLAAEVVQQPADFHSLLREQAPLYRMPNGIYLISRFEDVQRAVMDTETFSSNLIAVMTSSSGRTEDMALVNLAAGESAATDVLAIADPPNHTRQRKVTNRALTMRRVAAMEPRIQALAGELVDNFVAAGGGDWVERVAVPLPMTIIIELLGLPLADTVYLKGLSDGAVAILSGVNTEQEMLEYASQAAEMMTYLGEHFDRALRDPGDDILGDLARASRDDPAFFSRDAVVSMLIQLLTAGNESTSSLIGSAALLLLRDAGLQQKLRAQPALVEAFIEETLRLESPFKGHFRVTRRDTEVAGQPLPAGSRVMLLWGAANRDDSAFEDAARVDLGREALKKHMAFGYGIHHCIGAPLARAESRIAMATLLDRTAGVQLAPGNDFAYIPSLLVRGLRRLLVECRC